MSCGNGLLLAETHLFNAEISVSSVFDEE